MPRREARRYPAGRAARQCRFSRLRRLHEPRGSARQLDGVVLAFAGLARLWAEPGRPRHCSSSCSCALPRMVLPLSACPAAPAQGALAIECRAEDADTAAPAAALDDAPTRRAVEAERALLAERGGGCHQRLWRHADRGAASRHAAIARGARGGGCARRAAAALDPAGAAGRRRPASIRAWDGSLAAARGHRAAGRGRRGRAAAAAVAPSLVRRASPRAARRSWRPASGPDPGSGCRVWPPGVRSPSAVSGSRAAPRDWALRSSSRCCASRCCSCRRRRLDRADARAGAGGLERGRGDGHLSPPRRVTEAGAPPSDTTHCYWHSGAQFERWRRLLGAGRASRLRPGQDATSTCGTRECRICAMFPQFEQWRAWLQR